jgi:hypothetical protein
VKNCGYPLCGAALPQEQRRQAAQYHISLAHKKVYDLTERRKFCSNSCFKASNYYRDQLETSPLWLREEQQLAARVQLLQLTSGEGQQPCNSQLPGRGLIVDISPLNPLELEPNIKDNLDNGEETADEESSLEETEESRDSEDLAARKDKSSFKSQPSPSVTTDKKENLDLTTQTKVAPAVKWKSRPSPEEQRAEEPPVEVVQRTLSQWFTARSFSFLFRSQVDQIEDQQDSVR